MAIRTIMGNDSSVVSQNAVDINQTLEVSIYPRGVPGYHFTPSVDKDGMMSWTNNGGLTNPAPVSVNGYVFLPSLDREGKITWTAQQPGGDGEPNANIAAMVQALNEAYQREQDNGGFDMRGYVLVPTIEQDQQSPNYGMLSWTLQSVKSEPNVQPVNIRGPKGEQGLKGEQFSIVKAYENDAALEADLDNLKQGDFV